MEGTETNERTVQVSFDIGEYADICSKHCGENPPLQWIEITQLSAPRADHGWRFG